MSYAIVEGAERFIEFMKVVFGGEEKERHMRDEKRIAHAEVQIGDSRIMLADATEVIDASPHQYYIYVEDVDVIYGKAIEHGAESVKAPYEEDYGARAAAVKDPGGNIWWLATLNEEA